MLWFRGWIGLLLILVLCWRPAEAQSDRPVLRLLVFESDAARVHPAPPDGVDDAAVPALATPAGRTLTASFLGHPIDQAFLISIRDRLVAYYGSIGRPFVAISIPAQNIATGALHVVITEIRRGRLRVEGNRWFDDRQYLGAIRTRAGDPIDTRSLADDTNWINREEHRHATIAVEPGADPSTYDLTVRARDSLPLDMTLAADNTGTDDTGLYRIGLAVDWSNALWRGDDLAYGFLTSSDRFRLLEHILSYTAYLPWRDSMTITAVNAVTRGRALDQPGGSSVNGRNDILSFRYNLMLPSSADFGQRLELGYDFKSTNSNVLNGGNLVFPTTSELDQFVAAYTARRNDLLGMSGVTAMLVGSPGHLTARNTVGALAEQQPGASPGYVYGRVNLERLTNLPLRTVWSARLTAQYSDSNLLPSEQLVFGGVRSVRGFMELGATRDEGVLIQNEWRFPAVKFDMLPWFRNDADSVAPFVFLDLGAGRNHRGIEGFQRSWIEMVSIGPGVTWQITRNAALRLSWGVPLVRNGHTGPFLGPQFGTQISF